MTRLRTCVSKLLALLGLRHRDEDLRTEVDAHIDALTEAHVRRGLSRTEAAAAARREFGGVEQLKERYRDQRGMVRLESILQDVRYALRRMRHSPGFTAAAVAMLAIGIGVNTAVFTVTNAVLFKGFRLVKDNDRLVYLTGPYRCCVSYPDFQDWRAQTESLEDMGAVADLRVSVNDDDSAPETYTATLITASTFPILGQQPVIGRAFTTADETVGAPPVAILGHAFWKARFSGNTGIVGSTVRINDVPTTVIGVMAEGFSFPQKQDLWLPLAPTQEFQRREARGLWFAFGRMRDGVTIDTVRAELTTIGQRLGQLYPLTNRDALPLVLTFDEFYIGPQAVTVYGALWGAVGLVLLIACANLANLLLARALRRSREISVHLALGAGRWRVIRQLLFESLTLSAMGAVAGWWIAAWAVQTYEASAVPPTNFWAGQVMDYSLDARVFLYLVAIATTATFVVGLPSGLRLSRLDVSRTVRTASGASQAIGREPFATALVTVQMALAVVLLAGALVMTRSFLNVYGGNVGFDGGDVLTGLVRLSAAKYNTREVQSSFYDRLSARLEAIAGVGSVSYADVLPVLGPRRRPFEIANRPLTDSQRPPQVSTSVIGPRYFRTLRGTVLSGREFTALDDATAVPVVIVNQRFAAAHWPGEDPLGKRVRVFDATGPGAWRTIVGVVAEIGNTAMQPDLSAVYLPLEQEPSGPMWMLIRARVPPETLSPAFRREVQALDATLPIWLGPVTLPSRLASVYWEHGLYGTLFVVFASVALLLASIGLYAVVSYTVGQRTQEIGIRMAVGGTRRDVIAMVVGQGMRPVAIGLVAGLAASGLTNRVLESQLIGVTPSDTSTLLMVAAVLLAFAVLGCWIPAWRATRIDPMSALRCE